MELLEHMSSMGSTIRGTGGQKRGSSCSQGRVRSKIQVKPKPKTCLVVPAMKTDHPEWLHLTNLDRVVNPTFVSVIFFYENVVSDDAQDGKVTFQHLTASLKDSLAKVLVEFYPLAGRLTLTDDKVMDLQCNDAGAIFTKSSVNLKLSQLGGPRPMPKLSGMDILDNVARVGSGLCYIPDRTNPEIPVLVVNVTKFLCGSIAVAANWHHTVADGFSGCHFVRSWAQVATGQALSLLPSHDRHLLKPRSPLDTTLVRSIGNYDSRKTLEPIQVDSVRQDPQPNPPSPPSPSPVLKSFILTKDTVQRLKENVNCNADDGCSSSKRSFTSAETVSAELWKLIMRARSTEHEEVARRDRSRFFMFVDGRKKLGLPPGYFGNVVCSACAESTQEELLKRPLSYAAGLISNATRAIDNEYFRSLIDWVEETGTTSSKNCQSDHVSSTGFDVAATFWVFLPLYEINFGWGKPALSVRNAPPRKSIDGIAMMPSPDGSKGNMVALLNLPADRMDKLEGDPKFQESAQPLRS